MRDGKRLKPGYRRLTNSVGALGVLLGCVLLVPFMTSTRLWLGLPLGSAPLDGIEIPFAIWIVAVIVATPVLFYVGCICVAGLTAGILVAFGRMTIEQAVSYAFLSRYPPQWLRRDA